MPAAHRDKPVVICLCFGGDVKEDVRLNVSAFTVKHAAANLTFSEWNGDHLTLLVEQYFLREELLPPESRSLLRKSLALIDEPDISFKHFNTLLRSIHSQDRSKPKDFLTAIRQMHISMWILYSWCREEDNLESAYLSSEVLFLLGWDLCKGFVGKNTKVANQIFETLDAIMLLYVQVTMSYVDKVLGKHSESLHALSAAVSPSCSLDVNFKLFDVLGRASLAGLWSYWYAGRFLDSGEEEASANFFKISETLTTSVKKLVINNPVLFSPSKDSQAIDIVMAFLLLSLRKQDWSFINDWTNRLLSSTYHSFVFNGGNFQSICNFTNSSNNCIIYFFKHGKYNYTWHFNDNITFCPNIF